MSKVQDGEMILLCGMLGTIGYAIVKEPTLELCKLFIILLVAYIILSRLSSYRST